MMSSSLSDKATAVRPGLLAPMVLSFIVLGVLFALHSYGYLLFHSAVELFGIVVACAAFTLVWNARELIENDFLFFLGIALLGVGLVDLAHTLAYYGMGVFPGHGRDLPTQLWIGGRYVLGASFLVAPLFLTRRLRRGAALAVVVAVSSLLVILPFIGAFPACFVEGVGLTRFKIASEWTVCGLTLIGLIHLAVRRERVDRRVFRWLALAMIATIGAELAFTLYTDVYGLSNVLGHVLKLIAVVFIYRAVIRFGLREPYALLFRELRERESELERTLEEIKTLRGIVPICSSCKKIRDDSGYWQQVETYLRRHTDADFSHGFCEDCARRLFPDFVDQADDPSPRG